MPKKLAMTLLMPKEGCSIRVFQMMPATASMTKNGAIRSVRAMFTPGNSRLSRSESTRPRKVQATMDATVNTMVLPMIR